MITASQSVSYEGETFDGWTFERIDGQRVESGVFSVRLTLVRCHELTAPATKKLTAVAVGNLPARVQVVIPNIYAPAGTTYPLGSGQWEYTSAIRTAVLTWAAAGESATTALMDAQGVR